MPDFTLEPDEIEPERPARSNPVHLVRGGLHPTAEVPTARGRTTRPSTYPAKPVAPWSSLAKRLVVRGWHSIPTADVYGELASSRRSPCCMNRVGIPVHQCGVGGPSREAVP